MTSINLIRLHHRIHFFYQGGICSILHYFPSVDCNLIESWIWFCLLLPLSPVFLTHLRPFCYYCCCNLSLQEDFLVVLLFAIFFLPLFVFPFPLLPYELYRNLDFSLHALLLQRIVF